jgi:hypothetical protein
MVDVFAVVEVGPGHYEIQVAEFGTIHMVPPATAATVYRDPRAEQRSSDSAMEAIEGVLADIRESWLAASPILQRASQVSSQPAAQPPAPPASVQPLPPTGLANPIRVGVLEPEEGGASVQPLPPTGLANPIRVGVLEPEEGGAASPEPAAEIVDPAAVEVPPVVHGAAAVNDVATANQGCVLV